MSRLLFILKTYLNYYDSLSGKDSILSLLSKDARRIDKDQIL
jgi:hypothetical protein